MVVWLWTVIAVCVTVDAMLVDVAVVTIWLTDVTTVAFVLSAMWLVAKKSTFSMLAFVFVLDFTQV